MARGKTTMEVGSDGIPVITINIPPVNALSADVILSLKENHEQAMKRDDVKAVVVTGARGRFSGRADITSFGGGKKEEEIGAMSVNFVVNTLEGAKKPSVAAFDGLALRGGLEIAMEHDCHVSLGFLKTSKPIKGEEAHKLGFVDSVVSPGELIKTARQWALDIAECRRPWIKSLYKTDKIEPHGEAREVLKFARAQARKQAPHLQHPLVCIDVIEEGTFHRDLVLGFGRKLKHLMSFSSLAQAEA